MVEPIDEKMRYFVSNLAGGMNVLFAPHLIDDSECTNNIGWGYGILGDLSKVEGRVAYGNSLGTRKVSSLFRFIRDIGGGSPARKTLAFYDTAMRVSDGPGLAWTVLESGLTQDSNWEFAVYENVLYATNGIAPLKSYDGTTWGNAASQPANVGKCVFSFAGRLWSFAAAGAPNVVYYSGLATPNFQAATAGSFVIYDSPDDFIVGGGTIRTPELLVIFKNTEFFVVPFETDRDLLEYRLGGRPGCVSRRSIATWDDGIVWLGKDGRHLRVFMWTGGGNPMPISMRVTPILDDIPEDRIAESAASIHDGKYRLSIYGRDGERKTLVFDIRSGALLESPPPVYIEPWEVNQFSRWATEGDQLWIAGDAGMIYQIGAGKREVAIISADQLDRGVCSNVEIVRRGWSLGLELSPAAVYAQNFDGLALGDLVGQDGWEYIPDLLPLASPEIVSERFGKTKPVEVWDSRGAKRAVTAMVGGTIFWNFDVAIHTGTGAAHATFLLRGNGRTVANLSVEQGDGAAVGRLFIMLPDRIVRICDITAGRWHRVEAVIDLTAGLMPRISVDGDLYDGEGIGFPLRNRDVGRVDEIRFLAVGLPPRKTSFDEFSISRYTASGTYTSPVFDVGAAEFGGFYFVPRFIGGTNSVRVDTRAGSTAVPDAGWSAWEGNIRGDGAQILSPPNRYIQYRVALETTNSGFSPSVFLARGFVFKLVYVPQWVEGSILAEWHSKKFDMGLPERDKRFHRFIIDAERGEGTLMVQWMIDDGRIVGDRAVDLVRRPQEMFRLPRSARGRNIQFAFFRPGLGKCIIRGFGFTYTVHKERM